MSDAESRSGFPQDTSNSSLVRRERSHCCWRHGSYLDRLVLPKSWGFRAAFVCCVC